MKAILFILPILANVLTLNAAFGASEKKVALLIGNSSYSEKVGPLSNPGHDVEIVRRSLEAAGFEAKAILNASYAEMLEAVNSFSYQLGSLGEDAVGFFIIQVTVILDQYIIPITLYRLMCSLLAIVIYGTNPSKLMR